MIKAPCEAEYARPRIQVARRRKELATLLSAISLYLFLALLLAYTKAPWCDEAWFANPAYNLAFHGRMATNLLEPSGHFLNAYLSGIQERTYIVVPNHLLALAGWFRIFGASPFSTRVYSILWGVLAIPVLFYVLYNLFPNPAVARLGTLLTAIDFIYLWTTADGRMEASTYALSMYAVASYLYFRRRNFDMAVLASQVLGAAACFTHPNAVLMLLGIAAIAFRFDRSYLRAKHLLFAAVPYVTAAALWSVYILQSPSDWKAQFLANAAGRDSSRWKVIAQPWIAVWYEILRQFGAYVANGLWSAHMNPAMLLIPVLYVAALGWLYKNWNRSDVASPMLLTWITTLMLGMTFLNGFKAPCYLIYVVAFQNGVLAAWVLSLWSRRADSKLIAVVIVAVFAAIQVSTSVQHIEADELHRYYLPVLRDVAGLRSAGRTIVAGSSLGFGMNFEGFRDDARLGRYTGFEPDILVLDRSYRTFARIFEREEPEVFEHVVSTVTSRYRLVKRYGPFWIFERLPRPISNVNVLATIGGQQNERADRLFQVLSGSKEPDDRNPYL